MDVEIVENHVQVSRGEGCDHILEEAQEVDRSAALFDVSYDLAAGNLESRQEGLGAVTNILVGPAARFGAEAEYGPALEFPAFRRHTIPAHFLADSNTGRQCPAAWLQNPDPG